MSIGKSNLTVVNYFLKEVAKTKKIGKFEMWHKNNKSIEAVASILTNNGFIAGYGINKDENKISIRLFKKGYAQLPFYKIDLKSTPSRLIYISAFKLKQLADYDLAGIHLLYTRKGILDQQEAINCQTGGILIARIGL